MMKGTTQGFLALPLGKEIWGMTCVSSMLNHFRGKPRQLTGQGVEQNADDVWRLFWNLGDSRLKE
jgi:hypothetical protein